MPAQQMTPLSGALVCWHHWTVAVTADWREEVEETSVRVKRVRFGSWREEGWDGSFGGGLRSSMETLALWERRVKAVLRPRPEEPPEIRKVRFEMCMVVSRVSMKR